MSNSRKRLIRNEPRETSNHTEILDDEDEMIDLDQFKFEKPTAPPAQRQSQQFNQQNQKPTPTQSVSKGGTKQTNIMSFIQKPKSASAFDFDINAVSIREQIEIENQIKKKKEQSYQDLIEQRLFKKDSSDKSLSNSKTPPPQPTRIDIESQMFKSPHQKIKEIKEKEVVTHIAQASSKNIKPINLTSQLVPNQIKAKSGYSIQFKQGLDRPPLQKATQQQPNEEQKPAQPLIPDSDLLKGLTIVITGLISICSRPQLENILKKNGAKVTGSVSGKTSYLIVGEKLEDGRRVVEGNKYKQATKQGTKIVNEDELDEWFYDKLGQHTDELFQSTSLGKLYKKSIQQAPIVENLNISLADKYSPHDLTELIGNKSSVASLVDWINRFHKEEKFEQKKKQFTRVNVGRWQPVGNENSKACLISGPPGIGKSSMVRLVCESQNLKIITTNASIMRNKAAMRNILNDLIDNKILMNRFRTITKFIILMDEVDGMSGSDRGGLQALVECIKETRIPIVCICNDNESRKLMTLIANCYHIKFLPPESKQVANRLHYICQQEKLKYSLDDLIELAACFNCDIRQCINYLHWQWKSGKNNKDFQGFSKERVPMLNNFNAVTVLLNREQRKQYSLREQMDLFFLDYDMIPLMIQDSYVQSQCKDMQLLARAAELISEGDILSKKVRQQQQWALMPSYGFMSCVYPSSLVGEIISFPKFPTWLGKNSSYRKHKREMQTMKQLIGASSYLCSDMQIYSKHLMNLIRWHLQKDHIEEAAYVMEEYNLNPDILKTELVDLVFGQQNPLIDLSPQIKASLSRYYNKRHQMPKGDKGRGKKIQTEIQISQNYNPAVGEEAPLVEELIDIEANDDNDNNKSTQQSKLKSKKNQTKKRSKNNTISNKQIRKTTKEKSVQQQQQQQQQQEEDSDLSGFIVNDDDDD